MPFSEFAFSAVDLQTTLAMLTAGIATGAFILWQLPSSKLPDTNLGFGTFLISLLGVLFFFSRGVALYFEGSTLWPRNIGFAVLWIAYVISMTATIWVRRRMAPWLHPVL